MNVRAEAIKLDGEAASFFMVENEKGKGFAFRVRLPVSRGKNRFVKIY